MGVFKINDLNTVFDNVDHCYRVLYSKKRIGKSYGVILIAGATAFRGNVTEEELKDIEDRINTINIESKAGTGRNKILEFEDYQDLAQLATW